MLVCHLGTSQRRRLAKYRHSRSWHQPHFHTPNPKRPVVSRETEVVFQRPLPSHVAHVAMTVNAADIVRRV